MWQKRDVGDRWQLVLHAELWSSSLKHSVQPQCFTVLTYWHKHERTFTHSRAEVKDTIIKHKLKQGFHRITPTGRVRPFHSSGAKSQTVVASGFKISVEQVKGPHPISNKRLNKGSSSVWMENSSWGYLWNTATDLLHEHCDRWISHPAVKPRICLSRPLSLCVCVKASSKPLNHHQAPRLSAETRSLTQSVTERHVCNFIT